MSTDDDEQERLLRALRAGGSDAELSEEERYRAMFRAAQSPAVAASRRSSTPRRLVVGGAAAAVLALGTGGVAAAYSGNLPSPIQTFAHHVIGAPEASAQGPSGRSPAPSARKPSAHPTPAPHASASPSGPTEQPRAHASRHASSPPRTSPSTTVSPSPAASSTPSPSPSPTPTGAPAPVLTGVTVVGTSRRADVGARPQFAGRLSWSGTPTKRPVVVLQERAGTRWAPVSRGRADRGGSITLTAPALQRTSTFRLLARQGSTTVRSAAWRVAMHPLVTARASAAKKQATIAVTTSGGVAGDGVTLATRRDGHLVIVGRGSLDGSGTANFSVTPGQRRTTYVVVLDPTKRHTSARATVVVRLTPGAKSP